SLVMVPEQAHRGVLDNEIDALPRVRAIPDDVSQAINLRDSLLLDVGEHSLETFEVPMNIADDGFCGQRLAPWGCLPSRFQGMFGTEIPCLTPECKFETRIGSSSANKNGGHERR